MSLVIWSFRKVFPIHFCSMVIIELISVAIETLLLAQWEYTRKYLLAQL